MPNLYFNEEMFVRETLSSFVKMNLLGYLFLLLDVGLSIYFKIEKVINIPTMCIIGAIAGIATIILVRSWIDLMMRRRHLQNHYGTDVNPSKFSTRLASLVPKLYVKETYSLKMGILLSPLIGTWLLMACIVML